MPYSEITATIFLTVDYFLLICCSVILLKALLNDMLQYSTNSRAFIFVFWMFISNVTVVVNVQSEISERITYWKTMIQNNINVFKDVIEIDENNLWCAESVTNVDDQQPERDTCPTQAEKLPICHKDEKREHFLETLNEMRDDDLQMSEIDGSSELSNLNHNYKYLLKEYNEVKELCKEAETSHVRKLCSDLEANMRKLFKLHNNLENLKRRVT